LKANAAQGGFIVDAHELEKHDVEQEVTGTVRGFWGFEGYEGPRFEMKTAHSGKWNVAPTDQSALVVGRDDILHIQSMCAPCVEKVVFKNDKGKEFPTGWKVLRPDTLEVQVALKNEAPGSVTMSVKQFGLEKSDEVALQTYAEAAKLEKFTINWGDRQGLLRGTRLDEVESVELKGVKFTPSGLSRSNERDELRVAAANALAAEAWKPEEKVTAHVALKDARVLDLQTTVEAPRPKVTLVSKNVQAGAATALRFGNQDELPQDARLSFFLKTVVPEKFPHSEKIEVATADESAHTMLSVADGTLVMQDAENLLANLDPMKSFGASVFGPLRFRAVASDGTKGDWEPLATLVRLPTLKEIRCPDSPDKQCKLSGTNLFLIDSVASDAQFTHTSPVPAGFMEPTLSVPRPNGTILYVKLRDDPATVNMAVLPVLPE
jgi:hypothetical protein